MSEKQKERLLFFISLTAFLISFVFDGFLDGHWFHDVIVLIMCAGFVYIWDNRGVFRPRNNEDNNARN